MNLKRMYKEYGCVWAAYSKTPEVKEVKLVHMSSEDSDDITVLSITEDPSDGSRRLVEAGMRSKANGFVVCEDQSPEPEEAIVLKQAIDRVQSLGKVSYETDLAKLAGVSRWGGGGRNDGNTVLQEIKDMLTNRPRILDEEDLADLEEFKNSSSEIYEKYKTSLVNRGFKV